MKVRKEYKLTEHFGSWQHSWLIVGRYGAVNLHITERMQNPALAELPRFSGGIEIHYRAPPDYMSDQPPSQERCWAFEHGSPCWHDGSSLQAEERYIPLWRTDPHNHERMFDLLMERLPGFKPETDDD